MQKGRIFRLLSYRFKGTPEEEKEFNEWYNKTHIVHALSEDEYLDGYRYQDIEDPHEYLTVYYFASEESFHRMRANLGKSMESENTKQWLYWSKNYLEGYSAKTYRQLYPEGPVVEIESE